MLRLDNMNPNPGDSSMTHVDLTAYINIDNTEHLVTDMGGQLIIWDTELLKRKVVYKKHHPNVSRKGFLNFCSVDAQSVACSHVLPIDECCEIDVLDIRPGKWFPIKTLRVELGWRVVGDMCHTLSSDGPQLVLSSWQDKSVAGSVAGVGLHDGKIRWKITSEEAGVTLQPDNVCADQLGRVLVTCARQHSIYILSSEDGALIGRLNLDPPVFFPTCVRIHQDKLWVAHLNKAMRTTGEWKWQISQYDVD